MKYWVQLANTLLKQFKKQRARKKIDESPKANDPYAGLDPYAILFKARMLNAEYYGRDHAVYYLVDADQVRIQELYRAVATRDVDWHASRSRLNFARIMAAQAAATRSLLGIGIGIRTGEAYDYAKDLEAYCEQEEGYYANQLKAAARIKDLAYAIGTALAINHPNPSQLDIQWIPNAIVAKQITPEVLNAHIKSGRVRADKILEGSLWLLNEYLKNELSGYPDYRNTIGLIQGHMLGLYQIESDPKYNESETPVIPDNSPPQRPRAQLAGQSKLGRKVEGHWARPDENEKALPTAVAQSRPPEPIAPVSEVLSADTPESEYPQAIWDLYHKAFKIYNEKRKIEQPLTDDDVKTILDLYQQTGFTSAPRTWAGLLADVYESENHSFTDHGKARELRVQTAFRPFGEVEAFNLAQGYFNPPPGGEIDNTRAVYWLTIAANQFDAARGLAIRLINYHDELAPLRPHLPALVSDITYDLDDPKELRTDAGRFLARAHNAGLYGLPMDQAKAQAYYHAVATHDVNWSPYFPPSNLKYAKREAALAAATRSLLGIGTVFDPRAAAGYAQLLFDDCDPDDISHADERRAAIRIHHLAETMLDANQHSQERAVRNIVADIITNRLSPEKLAADLVSGTVNSTELLEGCLAVLNTYLDDECVGYPSYLNCVAQVQLRLLGHTTVHPVESQFRYNFVDATQKPVLGAIVPRSEFGGPAQGFGRFRGLSVTAAGEINFAFDPADSKQLPLIVPEDIEVALALAFGDDKAIWPAFSAEPPAPLTPSSPKWIPFTAQWQPKWLGHTALGNTLFATDCEAGPLLLWQIGRAQVIDDQGRNPSLARLRSIVAKMSDVEDNSNGRTNFLTFKVAAVELTWSQTEHSTPHCTVKNAVVGLQTGTIDERDTRTYTNNRDFATGYRAALFNANFELFAEHYPLLERYRQLATLITALNELRGRGFEPAAPIRAAITESYNSYVRRPAPAQASQLFY